jgi:hypothetical protein
VYEDDVSAVASDLQWSDPLLIKWKSVVQRTGVGVAYHGERLIEAAIEEFIYVPSENLGMRLLLFGQLHIARRRNIVVAINGADEFAHHATGIAPT